MRVRHLLVMGLTGLLVAAWCPPAVEADAAAADGAQHRVEVEALEDDPASYGSDHLVVAGAREPGRVGPQRFMYLAYYPTNLRIHRGDVVFFRIDQFHTVTFSADGQPRQGWLRRDEAEPLLAFDDLHPSDPTCGTSAEAQPCVLDSTDTVVHSGWKSPGTAISYDLKLAVDLPEGAYTYHCIIHPGMEGTVEVVPDEQPIPRASDVAAQREAEVVADTATAQDILDDPPEMPDPENVPATPTSPAHRRWFVQAGHISGDQRVSVWQYFPSSLEIAPGDEVEFRNSTGGPPLPGRTEPTGDLHTATFGEPGILREVPGWDPLALYINPMCDPDDPRSGLPGAPMFAAFFLGCPHEDLELEVGLQPWMHPRYAMRAPQNTVVSEATYDDSGMLLPPGPCRFSCDPWTGDPWPSTSTSTLPNEGQFPFRCNIHSVMRGAVTVDG